MRTHSRSARVVEALPNHLRRRRMTRSAYLIEGDMRRENNNEIETSETPDCSSLAYAPDSHGRASGLRFRCCLHGAVLALWRHDRETSHLPGYSLPGSRRDIYPKGRPAE